MLRPGVRVLHEPASGVDEEWAVLLLGTEYCSKLNLCQDPTMLSCVIFEADAHETPTFSSKLRALNCVARQQLLQHAQD